MRSIILHLAGTTRDAVGKCLSGFAEAVGGEEWRFPAASSSPVLYIGFYDDLELESEPDDLEGLKAALGQMPNVSVIADISGRVPGDTEVRQFVESFLAVFRGVAWDGHTTHCWTLGEIQSGIKADGYVFFDYEGWYRD
jgi:hypothetical protein